MKIKLAEIQDATEIAKIHKQEIVGGFLSSLPLKFIEKLYACVIENDFCVVAADENKIIGFVAGTADIKKLYFIFAKRYFLISLFLLLPKILKIRKIFETLFYPAKNQNLPKAELLTIAVKKEFQGQGIADKMLLFFNAQMKNCYIKEYKVLVGSELSTAIKFYQRNGFEFIKEAVVHDGKKSIIYIKSI